MDNCGNFLVSIIMTTYNSEAFLCSAINSVIDQTYKTWELVIVDDCSTDRTIEILREYQDKDERIKVVQLKKNVGVAHARNIGMDHGQGEYFAFLDSDDMWNEKKLEFQLDAMLRLGIDFSYCDYEVMDKEENTILTRNVREKKLGYTDLLSGNRIGLLTVVLSKKIVHDFKMPQIRHEDYAMWLTICKNGYIAYKIEKGPLAKYRKHKSLSSNKIKSILWTWNIYRSYLKLSLWNAIKSISGYVIMGITNKR